jgi:hypothetical protein
VQICSSWAEMCCNTDVHVHRRFSSWNLSSVQSNRDPRGGSKNALNPSNRGMPSENFVQS